MNVFQFIVVWTCATTVVNAFFHSLGSILSGRRHFLGRVLLHTAVLRPHVLKPAACSNSDGDDSFVLPQLNLDKASSSSTVVKNVAPILRGQEVFSKKIKQATESVWKDRDNAVKSLDWEQEGYDYRGEKRNGMPHGRGTKKHPDGSIYEGEFKYGRAHGRGKRTSLNGYKLEGSFLRGKFVNGTGASELEGRVWNGTWIFGRMEGYGVEFSHTGHKYAGEYRNNWKHGLGTQVYPNGGVHAGMWKEGKAHGFGKLIGAKGHILEGYWQDGKQWNVSGTFLLKTGEIWHGTWVNNRREGYGETIFPDSSKYCGMFKGGSICGNGTLFYPNGAKHIGEWDNGFTNGYGRRISNGGYVLEGVWVKGKVANASGVIVSDYGTIRNGTWINGYREGYGETSFRNGTKYCGELHRDVPHGKGVMTDSNPNPLPNPKLVANGTWVCGKMDGYGEIIYKDGSQYCGELSGGGKHGKGAYRNYNGDKYVGEWVQDIFCGVGRRTNNAGVVLEGVWVNGEYVGKGDMGIRDAGNEHMVKGSNMVEIGRAEAISAPISEFV